MTQRKSQGDNSIIDEILCDIEKEEFADIDKRRSGLGSRTIAYMDHDNNAKIITKISTGKNIDNDIITQRVRDLKVVTIGAPSNIDQDIINFLTQ